MRHNPGHCMKMLSCYVCKLFLGKQQLLSIGDYVGTLHIMEVPWNLRRPSVNEVHVF